MPRRSPRLRYIVAVTPRDEGVDLQAVRDDLDRPGGYRIRGFLSPHKRWHESRSETAGVDYVAVVEPVFGLSMTAPTTIATQPPTPM